MMSTDFGYNARKAGQVAAFFVMQQGKLLNIVKLVKLIYMANREFMQLYDEPLFIDAPVSMRLGPVNIRTYEHINSGGSGWDEAISDRENHNVSLSNPSLVEEDLDELSEADLEVLHSTWKRLGHMNQWDLVKYTHDNCPEWEDPGHSQADIPYARIFKFLSKPNPHALERRILDIQQIDCLASGS